MIATVVGEGTFEVHPRQWRDQPGHCGINPTTIRYRVEVQGELDHRGFVVDVVQVRRYFADVYEVRREVLPSCELMAVQACMAMWEKAYNPVRVYAEIQASEHGYATFEIDRRSTYRRQPVAGTY